MSILLDQCVPLIFLKSLENWGYTVSYARDHIEPNADDEDVIALATKLDAVLVTIDKDFANVLDYPPAAYQGIIVLRYRLAEEDVLKNSLQQALAELYRDKLRGGYSW